VRLLNGTRWDLPSQSSQRMDGYSRLMGADEVSTLKGLTERRAIFDRLIGEHGAVSRTRRAAVSLLNLLPLRP
jgi:hypothetical protein